MEKMDQQKFKALLKETITLLCNNGLSFKSEFSVEAVIGITLDRENVLLVSIHETVRNGENAKSDDEVPAVPGTESTVNHLTRRKRRSVECVLEQTEQSESCRIITDQISAALPPRSGSFKKSFKYHCNGSPNTRVKLEPDCDGVGNIESTSDVFSHDNQTIREAEEDLGSGCSLLSQQEDRALKRAVVRCNSPFSKRSKGSENCVLNQKRADVSAVKLENLPDSPNRMPSTAGSDSLLFTDMLTAFVAREQLEKKTRNGECMESSSLQETALVVVAPDFCSEADRILTSGLDLSISNRNTSVSSARTSSAAPYQCKECGKRMASVQSLAVHESTVHRGRYRYSCPKCGKGYSVLSNLRAHIACKHDKRKEFVCGICGREYGYKHSLKEHILLVHRTHMNLRN